MKAPHSGWLSLAQACRRLDVPKATLLRLINEGELPAYRMGWMIRLLVADVEAYRRRRDAGEGSAGGPQE